MHATASPRLDLKKAATDCLKRVTRLIALWCFIFGWAGGLQAETFGDFTYEEYGGEVYITGYFGIGGEVTVPSEINGMPVTWIASWSPTEDNRTTSIIIPKSVYLGYHYFLLQDPFYNCTSLTEINVDPAHPYYASVDGCLTDKSARTLFRGRSLTPSAQAEREWLPSL